MQEQTFTFLKDRPAYYDLIIILAFIIVIVLGFSLKADQRYWLISLSVLLVVSVVYTSGRRVKIIVKDESFYYQRKKNQFSSAWNDIQFIEMANYPSTMGFNSLAHGPNAFRIITKSGSSDWIRPFIVSTDSSRKSGDMSNKIGDNISYLFDIVKQKSGVSPGLGSSFYNRKIK